MFSYNTHVIRSREVSLLVKCVVIDEPSRMKEVHKGLIILAMATAIKCKYFVRLDCPTGSILLESENGTMKHLYKSDSDHQYMFVRVQEPHRYIYTCGGKTKGTWSTEGLRATVTNATVRVDYGMTILDNVSAKIVTVCRSSSTRDTRTTTRSRTAPTGSKMTMTYDDLFDNMEGMQVCSLHFFINRLEIDSLEVKLTAPTTTSPLSTPRPTSSPSAINTSPTSTSRRTSSRHLTPTTTSATNNTPSSRSKVTEITTSGPGPSSTSPETPTPRSTTTTLTTTTLTTTTLTTTSTSPPTSPTTKSNSTTSPPTTTMLPETSTTTTMATTTTPSPEPPATSSSIEPEENTTTTSKPIEEKEDAETKSDDDVFWITIFSLVGVFGLSLTGGLVFVIYVTLIHCKNRFRPRGGGDEPTGFIYKDGDRPMPQVNENMEARDLVGTEDDSDNRVMAIGPPKPTRTKVLSMNELKDRFMAREGEHSADKKMKGQELEKIKAAPNDHDPPSVAVTNSDDEQTTTFKETTV